jgi:uncharacterized protein with HEPN domain
MLRDKFSLIYKLKACECIGCYIENKSKADLYKHEMMKEAVIRKNEIIGEASNRISKDLKARLLDTSLLSNRVKPLFFYYLFGLW